MGGVPHLWTGGGYPTSGWGYPSQVQMGDTLARSRWGGVPWPGPDGGTPARSRWGVPRPGPDGRYPGQVQMRGSPARVGVPASCGRTHTCENITFPILRMRAVVNYWQHNFLYSRSRQSCTFLLLKVLFSPSLGLQEFKYSTSTHSSCRSYCHHCIGIFILFDYMSSEYSGFVKWLFLIVYCFIIKYWKRPTRTGTVHAHVNIASFSVSFSPETVFELSLTSNNEVSWYPKLFQSLTIIIGAREISGFVTSAFVPKTIEDCGCLEVSNWSNAKCNIFFTITTHRGTQLIFPSELQSQMQWSLL